MLACTLNSPVKRSAASRMAFTMIELLVVIAVMVLLAVLLIPQIRVISKDRTLRESARVVSATIVEAVERARVEGSAGVVLVRNPRFYRYVDNVGTLADPQGARIFYACYSLFQLKNLPPYVGNYISDRALFLNPIPGNTTFDVVVPAPYDNNIRIETGTYLQLGGSPNKYMIEAVNVLAVPPFPLAPENLVQITFSVRPFQSGPPAGHGQAMTFKIHRRPKVMMNTEVSLPRGYFINLNYSGDLESSMIDPDNNDFTWTWFTQSLPVVPLPAPQNFHDPNMEPIYILFDSDGSVDRVLP
ncbi:MAG TPA: type II secretion system protein, partial [Pirellulaceae bacterium]|nr:type II secretion system protein [Pirellulaceae bacterium]